MPTVSDIKNLSFPSHHGVAYLDEHKKLMLKGLDGKVVIGADGFSQRYKSLKDRHIESYVDTLKSLMGNPEENIEKIKQISTRILDRIEMNDVSKRVYKSKTGQIDSLPKTKLITKVCLVILVVALFAGIIATGSLLTNLHIISSTIGIGKIPILADVGLLGFSGTVGLTYLVSKIHASNTKDSKVAEIVRDLDLTIRNLYLFSNLNDTTGTLVYILGVILILAHLSTGAVGWLTFASKCMAYPTGVLFIGSGLQQLYESSVELNNSFKTKNLINLIRSFSVIAMGMLFIVGLQSGTIGIGTNWILNLLPFIVIGMTMIAVRKQLNEIKDVSNKSADEKLKFLEKTLTLSEEELSQLKKEILNWDKAEVLKWLKSKSSTIDRIKRQLLRQESEMNIWENILIELTSQDREIDLNKLEEIKKMILREEIKDRTEKKIDAFAGKLELDTLKEVIELLNNQDETKEALDRRVNAVFEKVVKESKQKFRAEVAKLCINGAFLGTIGLMPYQAIYNISQAILNSMNISINITPRYRNVATAFPNVELNVHKKAEEKLLSDSSENNFESLQKQTEELLRFLKRQDHEFRSQRLEDTIQDLLRFLETREEPTFAIPAEIARLQALFA